MNREGFVRALFAMDAALERDGVAPLSKRWRKALTRWARRGTRRLVIRAGRQSGKSLTLCKLAVAMALYAGVVVPAATVAWAIFVSTSVSEATARLNTIATFLDKLGVPYERSGYELRMADQPLGFLVLACQHRTAVGRTAFAILGDEMSRWDVEGVNPAAEVWAAIAPMTVTIPQSIEVASSSPMGFEDLHAKLCDDGDTDAQTVVEGATWEFNPSVTKAECRSRSLDDRTFLREFGAVPQAGAAATFDPEACARAFLPRELPPTAGQVLIIDASSGKKDRWTYGIAGKSGDVVVFETMGDFGNSFWSRLRGEEIVDRLVALAKQHGIRNVHGDQREALMLKSAFETRGLVFHEHVWTAQSKPLAIERVRRWFADGLLVLPEHERLRKELATFEERLTPAGSFTFGARGSGSDDFVSLLLTCALADIEGGIRGHVSADPYGLSRQRQFAAAARWAGMPGRGFG